MMRKVKTRRSCFLLLSLVLISKLVLAQQATQTIKGKIVDELSGKGLPGATIVVLGSHPLKGSASDIDGYFRIENVGIGRCDLKITFLGYETYIVKELYVRSGKESFVEIYMKESVSRLQEVEITANTDKSSAINSMALISARQLTVEEASRYAGGFDDPARLASSFAGVASGMQSNGIVIRGNPAKDLLWRLEGVEIPNPNHFSDYISFGAGGITALSSQMLSNSDFLTAAFPAEYGNALSGVFDLHLRNGNTDKKEYTLQAGLTGLDVSAEGPFSKKARSSFLFNYRYSTYGLIGFLLPPEAGVINYQDLSYKLNFPTASAGVFSLWGIGTVDYQGREPVHDTLDWEGDNDREKTDAKIKMGVFGLSHNFVFSSNAMLKTRLAFLGKKYSYYEEMIQKSGLLTMQSDVDNLELGILASSELNWKLIPWWTNKSGLSIQKLSFDLMMLNAVSPGQAPDLLLDDKGRGYVYHGYHTSLLRLKNGLEINAGIHWNYFSVTGQDLLEPRLALRWRINERIRIMMAYGKHSKRESLPMYLNEMIIDDRLVQPNISLKMKESGHYIAGMEYRPDENHRCLLEAYYQDHSMLPVIPGGTFAVNNIYRDWYFSDSLINTGEGRNFGLDFTIERFLFKDFYYLITASVFRSYYTADDGIERSTPYDRRIIGNILLGKEWEMGSQGQNTFGLSMKYTFLGGDPYTAVDEETSLIEGRLVYDEDDAFSERNPSSNIISSSVYFRWNRAKYSSTLSLHVLNILGQKEYMGYEYNSLKNRIEKSEDRLVVPNISYKIMF